MSKYQLSCQVCAEYLPDQSAPQDHLFVFAYTVVITNIGEVAAQLISRHWVIADANGHQWQVKGLGVVGCQPLLKPGESFEYSSQSSLGTASGTMHGHYFFVAEDGERFEVPIAPFALEASAQMAANRVLH